MADKEKLRLLIRKQIQLEATTLDTTVQRYNEMGELRSIFLPPDGPVRRQRPYFGFVSSFSSYPSPFELAASSAKDRYAGGTLPAAKRLLTQWYKPLVAAIECVPPLAKSLQCVNLLTAASCVPYRCLPPDAGPSSRPVGRTLQALIGDNMGLILACFR